ncbi:MAG: hypothetical protein KKE94_15375 [Gammaproteobacteria bacterium]|nr:hypothetical protein [Gammaproteobacteria bacterium]
MSLINKIYIHFVGMAMGIILLLLGSFVPKLYLDVTTLLNQGAKVDGKGWFVIVFLALVGAAMFFVGHLFRAYNKRVAKHFDEWFKS